MDECYHCFSADKLLVTCSCVQCVDCRLNLTFTSISNLSPCLLCIVAYLSCDHFKRLLSDKRQNSHSFRLMRQNRQYQLYWLMCNWLSGFGFGLHIGVHNFIFSDMDWIWSRWKSFGLDQDCKISISVHHWLTGRWTIPGQLAFFVLGHDTQNCCFANKYEILQNSLPNYR